MKEIIENVDTQKLKDIVQNCRGDLFCHDASYPSDNDAEIPNLRMDMMASECTKPFCAWGEQKRTFNMCYQGVLHFYVDDYRFSVLYEHPEKILAMHPKNIVEPNFSLYADTPIAFGLQNIYKKRWIARCMQERGIKVFVDLNVNAKFYKLNMLGVPMGWRAFCTRGYSDRLNNLEYEYEIAKAWANGTNDDINNPIDPLFVIYGGGKSCKFFAQQHNCIYITPLATEKKKLQAMKTINEAITFWGEDFSIKGLANMTGYDRMICDFRKKQNQIENKDND